MSTHLLLNEKPLMVLPSLAKLLGINASIAVQQIHWIIEIKHENQDDRTDHQGYTWCKYTLNQWQSKMCWMTTDGIHKMLTKLELDGVIISCKPEAKSRNQTKWYRIDHDGLNRLSTKSISDSVQNPISDSVQNPISDSVQNDPYKKDIKDFKKKSGILPFEQKRGNLSDGDKLEDPKTPPIAPPAPIFEDVMGDHFRDMGKRSRQVEAWLKDINFLQYIQPIMKRSEYYKNSTTIADVRDYVRKAKINTPEKLVFYETLCDRYQDFLQESRPQENLQVYSEPQAIAPMPDNVKEFAAKLSKKLS